MHRQEHQTEGPRQPRPQGRQHHLTARTAQQLLQECMSPQQSEDAQKRNLKVPLNCPVQQCSPGPLSGARHTGRSTRIACCARDLSRPRFPARPTDAPGRIDARTRRRDGRNQSRNASPGAGREGSTPVTPLATTSTAEADAWRRSHRDSVNSRATNHPGRRSCMRNNDLTCSHPWWCRGVPYQPSCRLRVVPRLH